MRYNGQSYAKRAMRGDFAQIRRGYIRFLLRIFRCAIRIVKMLIVESCIRRRRKKMQFDIARF